MYLEKFIDYFNQLSKKDDDKNIELEIKLLIDPNKNKPKYLKNSNFSSEEYKQFFKYLYVATNNKVENLQTINFIDKCNDLPTQDQNNKTLQNQKNKTKKNIKPQKSLIKQLVFINSEQDKNSKKIYKKEQIHEPIYLAGQSVDFKITLNSEEDFSVHESYEMIRIKQRFRFIVDKWFVDFTFVKTSTTKSISEIKDFRDKMFLDVNQESIFDEKSYIWDYVDSIEVEFEFNNSNVTNTLTIEDINKVFNIINKFKISQDEKKETSEFSESSTIEKKVKFVLNEEMILKKIYNLVYSNSLKKGRDKQNSKYNSLKKILPNAIEINKAQYFQEILPIINKFYLTDKADGIRTILFIDDQTISLFNTEYKVIDSNSKFKLQETIFECEFVNDKFYIFDILQYNGDPVTHLKFNERYQLLQTFKEILINLNYEFIEVKDFTKLTLENYPDVITKCYMASKPYHVDGIIFTSEGEKYIKTKFYKWKDFRNMTIDFYTKKCPAELLGVSPYNKKKGHELYILFSGIKHTEYIQFGLTKIKHYNTLFQFDKSLKYFPVQFSPSDKPLAHIYYHKLDNNLDSSDNDRILDLDGKVIELRYDNQWQFVRVREDRTHDITQKNYYGNHFRVAELIWRNYSNPLTLDHLCSSIDDLSKEFYFKVNNSKDHLAVRNFNNMVKDQIFLRLEDSGLSRSGVVIDLCSGKGQDLIKYASMKSINKVLFIDNNENNLCEIIARKYGKFFNNGKFDPMEIFIQNLDLSQNAESIYSAIRQNNSSIDKTMIKLVVCNFAIHYFVKDIKSMMNFVNLIDLIMPANSRFIVTYMDGLKVANLLAKSNNQWGDEKKYLIKPKDIDSFKAQKRFAGGEEIEILLPFSNGELFSEYLVNSNLLTKFLKQKKITLESSGYFDEDFMDMFREKYPSRYNNMDDYDKKYTGLLRYAVYFKKTTTKQPSDKPAKKKI